MSDLNPTPTAQPDPKKPFKAYVGAAVAFLGLLWASLEGTDNLGNLSVMEWLAIIVPTILTWAGIYITPNPLKGVRRNRL